MSNKTILLVDRWPGLECQRLESELETGVVVGILKWYCPPFSSVEPIILMVLKYCKTQWEDRKCTTKFDVLVRLKIDIRLKENDGTHKTWLGVRFSEILTSLICVADVVLPLARCIRM